MLSLDCKRLSNLPAPEANTNARPGFSANLKLCGKKSARRCRLVAEPNSIAPLPAAAKHWQKMHSRPCEKKDAWPRSTGSTHKAPPDCLVAAAFATSRLLSHRILCASPAARRRRAAVIE